MKTVNIGIIGVGGIAKKHIKELLAYEDVKITAICDIDPKAIGEKNEQLQLPAEKCYENYLDLIADPDVDAVEICTPNHLHAPMAIDALKAGKPVNLEKPLAMSYGEALQILEAEKQSPAFGMTCFSYRFKPAVRFAKHLVDSGAIGRIVGLNVAYLKSSAFWEGRRLEWRFVKEYAASGVIGDLGVHLIDLAQLLAGNITELCATQNIVVTERKRLDSEESAPVETDDQCSFIAKFANGADGSFHITRCAIGHANTIRYDVYGNKGSLSFGLNNPTVLGVCQGEGDPKDLRLETVEVPKEFYLEQERAFVDAMKGKRDPLFPTLAHGAQGQQVVDAILQSAAERRWIEI
ncbi:MAG: Gfo/Idh/MocA family oxidoreductase [Clostridia bacterium]|nr:Gfo/Idh/MocA family oxidoreductase [Clostridia bacterium]